ncbi:Metallo-dependent phosphatase-like protein [Gymnopilus junonius]|uniref:Metallo-dependent phosphatase-like protein n=1 Tax=Gymnopilus junonius TaxID=109634 RepID=A0A9P5NTE3_GYMJU|nr:Metallo-dependent phosphatase-like protein [Gymnopilus junonius]
MTSINLPILHFNDVYRVTPQRILPGTSETIDVSQFAALVNDIRSQWPQRPDGEWDGLILFSGDVFSPSVESTVTRGSHMVPVLNELGIDAAVVGNHDFDFGYPHLSKLITNTNFPWLLSNIIDTSTSRVPDCLRKFSIIERAGLRIGFIGLVEKEWIATVSSWPPNFIYKSMKETGLELSKILRDPHGEYRCGLIIALTHSRLPNDIGLAKELLALSPTAQESHPICSKHGVDLILGGHDHIYFVSHGVGSWENHDLTKKVLGAEHDHGDILVIKSGTDFRDLSEINLKLVPTAANNVRRMVISEITGKRHIVEPTYRKSQPVSKLLKVLLGSVSCALKSPVCRAAVTLDVHSSHIRVQESAVTNWFADIGRHVYDDALCIKGRGGSDGVLFCAGTFRGDSVYGPGVVTMGDTLEILPFQDPIVVLEIDGLTLWEALESSLSTWPAQEGRFPSIAGFRVEWDSRKSPGERVTGIWVMTPASQTQDNKLNDMQYNKEPVKKESGDRKYTIVTREYMAQGHDGFTALTRGKVLIDGECGSTLSTIVRKYLLASKFVNKMIRHKIQSKRREFLQDANRVTIDDLHSQAGDAPKKHRSNGAKLWETAIDLAIHKARTKFHYQNHFKICETEHMSTVDPFDGNSARKGHECLQKAEEEDKDLPTVSPEIDGRLKDIARPIIA